MRLLQQPPLFRAYFGPFFRGQRRSQRKGRRNPLLSRKGPLFAALQALRKLPSPPAPRPHPPLPHAKISAPPPSSEELSSSAKTRKLGFFYKLLTSGGGPAHQLHALRSLLRGGRRRFLRRRRALWRPSRDGAARAAGRRGRGRRRRADARSDRPAPGACARLHPSSFLHLFIAFPSSSHSGLGRPSPPPFAPPPPLLFLSPAPPLFANTRLLRKLLFFLWFPHSSRTFAVDATRLGSRRDRPSRLTK